MKNLKLQYQLCNGTWADCNERTEEFLARCEKFNGVSADGKIVPIFRATRPLTRNEIFATLLTGQSLRNDSADWYSNCRSGSAYESKLAAQREAIPPQKLIKCNCGHTIPEFQILNTSTGNSCLDCYDRMSG